MPPRRRPKTSHEGLPEGLLFALRILGVLLLVALIFGGAWLLATLGPNRVSNRPQYIADQEIPKELSDQLQKSFDLERQFREAEKQRAIKPDDLPGLRQAIRLQEDYLEKTGQNSTETTDRLREMRTALETYTTQPMYEQIVELEKRADAEEFANRSDDAITLLRQAIKLQQDINNEYHLSPFREYKRLALMQRRINYLQALPLNNDSLAAETAARAALDREEWIAAQENFQHALDLQERVNIDYPDQPFVNVGRQAALKGELASLRSLGKHQQVVQSATEARAANAAGDYARAAELFQSALRVQRDLNNNFQDSRFASVKALDDLEDEWQTALSRPVAAQIQRQAGELNTLLRDRRTGDARELVGRLAKDASQFGVTYPHSPLLSGDLQQRLEYINFKRDEVAALQEQIYRQLVPVPGFKFSGLYQQEVPQSLYSAIVGSKPSRNLGDRLPVESVSWNEARDFCQRLSWLLGRPVRLPTVEEYRAALGSTAEFDISGGTWNMDNSGGRTQNVAGKAPAATGYYDLLGNVSEWLERPAGLDAELAPVAGGNAQTPIDSIRETPIANIKATERSRFTGFRFVVDLDPAAPAPSTDMPAAQPPAPAPAPAAN